jgi:hypothetical protein
MHSLILNPQALLCRCYLDQYVMQCYQETLTWFASCSRADAFRRVAKIKSAVLMVLPSLVASLSVYVLPLRYFLSSTIVKCCPSHLLLHSVLAHISYPLSCLSLPSRRAKLASQVRSMSRDSANITTSYFDQLMSRYYDSATVADTASTFFIAPTSGVYSFWVSGSISTELWATTNKTVVSELEWTTMKTLVYDLFHLPKGPGLTTFIQQ